MDVPSFDLLPCFLLPRDKDPNHPVDFAGAGGGTKSSGAMFDGNMAAGSADVSTGPSTGSVMSEDVFGESDKGSGSVEPFALSRTSLLRHGLASSLTTPSSTCPGVTPPSFAPPNPPQPLPDEPALARLLAPHAPSEPSFPRPACISPTFVDSSRSRSRFFDLDIDPSLNDFGVSFATADPNGEAFSDWTCTIETLGDEMETPFDIEAVRQTGGAVDRLDRRLEDMRYHCGACAMTRARWIM